MAKRKTKANTAATTNRTVGRVSKKSSNVKSKLKEKFDWSGIVETARNQVGSNVALAEALGVTETTVRNWLNGSSPPADLLVLLRNQFGYDPEFLLSGIGDPVRPIPPDSSAARDEIGGSVRSMLEAMENLAGAISGLTPFLKTSDQDRIRTSAERMLRQIQREVR